MKFTMARPEESCHPETLLPGARTVVSAALCYYAPEPERPAGHGRLPRYTWHDAYAELREKLDALGREIGGSLPRARRREPARRPGGRSPQRRRLLRQEHAADHAAARLLGRPGDARHRRRARADAAARPRLRRLPALHRRVPDGCARRAGHARRDALPLVLDAGGRADPRGLPCAPRRAGVRLRHLPGRLPVEPRRRETARAHARRASRTCPSSTGCARTPQS